MQEGQVLRRQVLQLQLHAVLIKRKGANVTGGQVTMGGMSGCRCHIRQRADDGRVRVNWSLGCSEITRSTFAAPAVGRRSPNVVGMVQPWLGLEIDSGETCIYPLGGRGCVQRHFLAADSVYRRRNMDPCVIAW